MHSSFGGYAALLRDIESNYPNAYHTFCRMCWCPEDNDELLSLITPLITHNDTNCRKGILPDERSTCRQTPDKATTLRKGVSFDLSKAIMFLSQFNFFLTVSQKKHAALFLGVTLANVD